MIHDINPIFISFYFEEFSIFGIKVGIEKSFHIYWYGIMYLTAFILAWFLGNYYITRKNNINISRDNFSDLLFYSFLGVLIGGRLGYSIFYNFFDTLENPISIFFIWNGGMSFHGGFVGVLLGILYFCQKNNISFFIISDFLAKLTPIGLFTGRIGNFINGELWGKPTDLFLGVIFPKIDNIPRHPTQLYEAFLEGILLFFILNFLLSKKIKVSYISGYFLIYYSLFRFIVEFLRVPDLHIGYILFDWVKLGQILCIPMFIFGLYILKIRKSD